jgi:DNA-binding NarL/FixJ family response regulator
MSCHTGGLEWNMAIRVVFADSHPLILAGLQYLMQQEDDIEVVACCRDGEETLQAAHQHRPDVVVLDLPLPGKDGWEVLRELSQASYSLQIVILTTALDVDAALQAYRLGVNGVVLKEMADRLLASCIRKVYAGERWIERRSVSQALEALLKREAGGRQLAATLTPRERELVRWVGCGLPNREIAKKLAISEGTVKIHLHRIYKKLQVPSRLALLQYAYEHGVR